VDGFSVDFDGQCRLFPDDYNIQERNYIVWLSELNGRP
jgi:hypothetical protein